MLFCKKYWLLKNDEEEEELINGVANLYITFVK